MRHDHSNEKLFNMSTAIKSPSIKDDEEEKKEIAPKKKSSIFKEFNKTEENNEKILNEYIKSIKSDIKPLIEKKKKARFRELISKLKNEKVTIIVAGFASAGKTTFINQLISYLKSNGKGVHEEFLPTDRLENTAFIWILEKSPYDTISISIKNKEEPLQSFDFKNEQDFISKIIQLNRQQKEYFSIRNRSIDLKDFPVVTVRLPFFIEGLRVIDCPGYSKKQIFENIKKFINSRIVHIIVVKSLENSVTNDEYFEPFIEDVKRTYSDLSIFLCFTQKDKHKLNFAVSEQQIKETIQLVRDHIAIMGKYKVSAKGIYLLNSKDRVDNYSMDRLMQDLKGLFPNYLGYNLSYTLSELVNIFQDESSQTIPEKIKEFNNKYKLIEKLKDSIITNFKTNIQEFFTALVSIKANEWENWKDDLKRGVEAPRKGLVKKSKIMNKVINNLKNQILQYLMGNIQQIIGNSHRDFLSELEKIVGRDYVSDVLCLGPNHLQGALDINYQYNRPTFLCLYFNESYSNLEKYRNLEGVFNRIIAIGFWFGEKGFWFNDTAYSDLVKHFCKIFEVKQEQIREEAIDMMNQNLQTQCEKFKNYKNFEENYQSAKKIINKLRKKVQKDLPMISEVFGKKKDLDLLEFEDFELDDIEREYFTEEKRQALNELLKMTK